MKNSVPTEFEGVAKTEDINALDDKVAKCYSKDRYEDFQNDVEKIVLKTIGSEDGGDKIKKHAQNYFKGQIGWGVLLWLVTLIASMFIQKIFKVF